MADKSFLESLLAMNIRNPNAPPSIWGPQEAASAEASMTPEQLAEQQFRNRERGMQPAFGGWQAQAGLTPAPTSAAPTTVLPESVMSLPDEGGQSEELSSQMPPEALMSQAPAAGPMAAGVPAPVAAALASAMSGSKSGGSPGTSPPAATAPQSAAPPQPPPAAMEDIIAKMLGKKQSDAEGDRDSAKDKAEHAKDLTDGEKVFTALMAVLPGLVGAIGGGAIAGPTGATAGLAGGLQGSAQGVGMMDAAKEQRRKEALGQMAQAQGRVDEAGNQLLGHQEKLGDQAFRTGERQATQGFEMGKMGQQQDFESEQNRLGRNARRGDLMLQIKADNDRAANALLAAQMKKGLNIEESDKAFYVNAHSAVRDIEELKKAINKNGNIEIAMVGDEKTRAVLKGRALDLAIAYAKIVDPGSAAKEGEVETAMKYGFPMGLLEGNETSMAGLDNILKMVQEKGGARMDLGLPVPASLNTNFTATSQQPSGGAPAAKMSNQQRFGF